MTHLDTVRLDDLDVRCVIGILPDERDRLQPVRVSVAVRLDVTRAAETGEIGRTLDYADLGQAAEFILVHGRFRLIETAALALCHYALLGSTLSPDEVTVTLVKPEALAGRGTPSVTVTRRRTEITERNGAVWRSPDAVVHVLTSLDSTAPEPGLTKRNELRLVAGVLRVSTP